MSEVKMTLQDLKQCHFVIIDPKFIKIHKFLPSYICVHSVVNKIASTKIVKQCFFWLEHLKNKKSGNLLFSCHLGLGSICPYFLRLRLSVTFSSQICLFGQPEVELLAMQQHTSFVCFR